MNTHEIAAIEEVANNLLAMTKQAHEQLSKSKRQGVQDLDELELMKRNFFLELSKQRLNGTQFSILCLIFHHTKRSSLWEVELSISDIATQTNKHTKQIARELREIIDNKFVIASQTNYTSPRTLRINFNYNEWNV